jgi:hypothetical protein
MTYSWAEAVEKLEARCESLEVVLEEAVAEFESHAISELPHIAYGYGKARDWLKRRLLRVERTRRGSWIAPAPTPDGPASPVLPHDDHPILLALREALGDELEQAEDWRDDRGDEFTPNDPAVEALGVTVGDKLKPLLGASPVLGDEERERLTKLEKRIGRLTSDHVLPTIAEAVREATEGVFTSAEVAVAVRRALAELDAAEEASLAALSPPDSALDYADVDPFTHCVSCGRPNGSSPDCDLCTSFREDVAAEGAVLTGGCRISPRDIDAALIRDGVEPGHIRPMAPCTEPLDDPEVSEPEPATDKLASQEEGRN